MQFAKAFCPGHITGFFEICDSDTDTLRRGSRGAGFSTTLGALSTAAVEARDRQKITVVVHGLDDYAGADVTIRAIRHLIGDARLKVEIETDLQLPVSQGFGMSGAGALSATLSVVEAAKGIFDLTRDDAVRAAHVAEVESRTGLGDVVGQSVGGFERRLEPGVPPFGKVATEPLHAEAVLCVLGGALETKAVLSDELLRARINAAGRKAVNSFSPSVNLKRFCETSWAFAREARLDTPEIAKAIGEASSAGCGSMAMLGNSVFAFGDAERLESIFSKYGRTFRCRVAPEGAKVLPD
jgi:pantoate kinase